MNRLLALIVLTCVGLTGCESAYFGKTGGQQGGVSSDSFNALLDRVDGLEDQGARMSMELAQGFGQYNASLGELSRQLDVRFESRAQAGIDDIKETMDTMEERSRMSNRQVLGLGVSGGAVSILAIILIVVRYMRTGKMPGDNGDAT